MNTKPDTTTGAPALSHTHTFGQDQKLDGERRTLIVIGITVVMMVMEIAGGIAFGSMALLADGIHMASHTVALGINAFAYIYARRHAADERFTFGTGKVNALGGFAGAILLAMFALMMAWESVERLFSPTAIAFDWAIGVAVLGLVVNGASVFILGHRHEHEHDHEHDHEHESDHEHAHDSSEDHNLRSAYLHVMADALTSVTAIFALLTAKFLGWNWMDPLMGIVGSLLVARWSVGLLKTTSAVLLDRQAGEATVSQVRSAFPDNALEQCYDLHVWQLAPGKYGVILGMLCREPRNPDDFRKRLDPKRFPHVTVEVTIRP